MPRKHVLVPETLWNNFDVKMYKKCDMLFSKMHLTFCYIRIKEIMKLKIDEVYNWMKFLNLEDLGTEISQPLVTLMGI